MRFIVGKIVMISGLGIVGCSAPWTKKEPESELQKRTEAVQEVLRSDERPRLIGEAAVILGTDTREYEGFGIVNGLMDTGGDVRPGAQREFMLKELRAESVENPNGVLASKSTAMARLRLLVGPESTKGDALDLWVEIASDCEATSLRNGWLMPSRILDMQYLGGSVKQSELKARAQGALVILPKSVTQEEVDLRSAVILGGAKLLEPRRFVIRIRDSLRHVTTSAAISRAINEKYSFYDGSDRKGVATAKNDNVIQLEVPSRHRWDVQHYTDSILAIGFIESSEEKSSRIAKCQRMLSEPSVARKACLELEALGKEGIPVLEEGLKSNDPEIRFYAAYSLAYLDHASAAAALGELAGQHNAFRPLCLIGLQLSKHHSAREELERLLEADEPELRYGAFLALRRRDPLDPLVQGTAIGDLAQVTSLPSAKPLVAVSLQERPEIVLFGECNRIEMQSFYEVNSRLTMRGEADGQIRIVRFQPSDEDLTAIVQPDVQAVLEGFRSVGATYNDIVCWLDEASRQGWVKAQIALNPRPDAGRVYRRDGATSTAKSRDEGGDIAANDSSSPNLADKKSWFRRK